MIPSVTDIKTIRPQPAPVRVQDTTIWVQRASVQVQGL